MRASTLFALTAAVLIGLGVAVAARMSGYFSKPPAEVALKKPDVQILVAARNLFAGDAIDSSGIRVRAARPDEKPQDCLPPVPAAAVLRVAKVNIEADTPITRDSLKAMEKPTPLNERLLPDMRAVNIVLPKERSAGGLVQVGEWVEVYLTSAIDGTNGARMTRTAAIAPKVRLIAKRDTLWQIFAPLPKDKPVEYTLEVNSYRAALIEFSRNKGVLSMSPLPQVEQKKLEASRIERLAATKGDEKAPIQSSPEDQEESQLVQGVERGELIVTEQDLVLLFNLKIDSAPPPPAMVTIERFSGTRRLDSAEFTLDGQRSVPTGSVGYGRSNTYPHAPYSPNVDMTRGHILPNNYLMRGPTGNANNHSFGFGDPQSWRFNAPDCPTCKKNKY